MDMRRLVATAVLAAALAPAPGSAATPPRESTCKGSFRDTATCTLTYRGDVSWVGASSRSTGVYFVTLEVPATQSRPAEILASCFSGGVSWSGCAGVAVHDRAAPLGSRLICRVQGRGTGTFSCGSRASDS